MTQVWTFLKLFLVILTNILDEIIGNIGLSNISLSTTQAFYPATYKIVFYMTNPLSSGSIVISFPKSHFEFSIPSLQTCLMEGLTGNPTITCIVAPDPSNSNIEVTVTGFKDTAPNTKVIAKLYPIFNPNVPATSLSITTYSSTSTDAVDQSPALSFDLTALQCKIISLFFHKVVAFSILSITPSNLYLTEKGDYLFDLYLYADTPIGDDIERTQIRVTFDSTKWDPDAISKQSNISSEYYQ